MMRCAINPTEDGLSARNSTVVCNVQSVIGIHGSPGTEIPGIGTEIGVFGHV